MNSFKKEVTNIIDALKGASTGKVVFESLKYVPIENLKNMRDMINYILKSKKNDRIN